MFHHCRFINDEDHHHCHCYIDFLQILLFLWEKQKLRILAVVDNDGHYTKFIIITLVYCLFMNKRKKTSPRKKYIQIYSCKIFIQDQNPVHLCCWWWWLCDGNEHFLQQQQQMFNAQLSASFFYQWHSFLLKANYYLSIHHYHHHQHHGDNLVLNQWRQK